MNNESEYCKKCNACGDNGCCSWTNCFMINIKDKNCKYGIAYLKEALFDKEVAKLGGEIISEIEDGKLDKNFVVEEYHKRWDKIYDKIHKLH